MKTILVTGGAGFIGSHVCERLLADGCHVVCLDSFNDFYAVEKKESNAVEVAATAQRLAGTGVRFVLERGDIRDAELLDVMFSRHRPDAVIHLAAYAGVRPSIQDPALYYDVNVTGTLRLLEAMRKHDVKSLVFASSSSVYGNNEKVPFSEMDVVDNPISPYAATKKSGELMCHAWHHLHGISVACLRFFTVFGPRQRPDLAIRKFTEIMLRGEELPVFGDGSTERDYTFISDIVDGVVRALGFVMGDGKADSVLVNAVDGIPAADEGWKPVFEVFNMGESQTISLNRMISGIEAAVGQTAKIRRLPEQPGDVKRTFADVSKARRMLGYAPTTKYEDGVKVFVEWLRGQ